MRGQKLRAITGIVLIAVILCFSLSPQFQKIYALPRQMRLVQGEAAALEVGYPLTLRVADSADRQSPGDGGDWLAKPVFVDSLPVGKATLNFKLLGLIPIKQVDVEVVPPMQVLASGQSIGVILHSNGVMVVGSSSITDRNGKIVNPARDGGIDVGDIITEINGVKVNSDVEVATLINECGRNGRPAVLRVKRNDGWMEVTVAPAYCAQTERYRIGLFVRDSAVGVGTLTFYEPRTLIYGALGHSITDSDTNKAIECQDGRIVPASVTGINSGKIGRPGEKIGNLLDESSIIGNIAKNTEFGIYGTINEANNAKIYAEVMNIASMNQIEPGPAEIMTVIDGQTVEKFAIDIEKINMQDYPKGKGLVIKVTDRRLLDKTGGIVQGMSGSPIVQNGKLIGAITHVFIHDPTKGYGCFVDWMLMESGIVESAPSEIQQLFS